MPQERLREADDFAILDEDRAPGGHAALVEVIVPDDVELCFHGAFRGGVGHFARLHVRAEVFLPVLEAHGHVGFSRRPPEEGEILSAPVAPVELDVYKRQARRARG